MLHQIGAGVLGPVFRAYQPAPGRLVAIKQFRLGLAPESADRFVSTLNHIVAADLTHPGIAAPIACGLADASPYLALDFVAGESFDVVLRENGPGQPKDVVHLARQLSGALDAAAAVGVVHGALHPRDVLMTADEVRMTGLGIAQALEGVGLAAPIRRPYAAPERTAGAPWDRRADIYSLAALAYEMLTGRRVVAAGRDAAESLPAIEGVDVDRLRVAFAKGLAERAADRFEHARELADALERALMPVARGKAGARRRKVEPSASDLELPLDIELTTPPMRELADVHPLAMAAIDAALPSAEQPIDLPLTLADDRNDHDFQRLDTRLDELAPPPVSELALHAIERGRALDLLRDGELEAPDVRLEAVDAASERAVSARGGASDVKDVDTSAIELTVKPLATTHDARPTDAPLLNDVDVRPAHTSPAPEASTSVARATVGERERHSEYQPGEDDDVDDSRRDIPSSRPASDRVHSPALHLSPNRSDARADDRPTAFGDIDSAMTDLDEARGTGAEADDEADGAFVVDREGVLIPAESPERLNTSVERAVFAAPASRALNGEPEAPSPSGNWPIVLGVAFGLLVGFAFGYGFGQWRLSGPTLNASQAAVTESGVTDPTSTSQSQLNSQAPTGSASASAPIVAAPAASASGPSTALAAASIAAAAKPASAPKVADAKPSTQARGSAGSPAAARQNTDASARRNAEGRLTVRTTPAGARVTIDGKDAGLTPLTMTLPPGAHVVRLAHQGYVAAERRVRIGSQPAQPIDLELVARPTREIAASPATPERASGSLVLDSRPSGARVFVDEALVGTTPMQVDAITSGDHKVRFEMDGFGPWSTTAKVTAGGKTRVSGSLER